MGRIGQKKPETNIFKCLWYKVQLFGVTIEIKLSLYFFAESNSYNAELTNSF